MQKVIGVTELQRKFRTIFEEVAEGRTAYVLTRGSRPEAVLISYDDFLRFQEMQEQEVLARFDRVMVKMKELNADHSDVEVEGDVEMASQSHE